MSERTAKPYSACHWDVGGEDRFKKKYTVFSTISPFEVHKVFEKSDIILSRSGANTVSEIIITKRPAILAPLVIGKWSEQEYNAEYAKNFGVARVIKHDELSSQKLKEEILSVTNDWGKIVDKIKDKKSPDENADKKLVDVLEKYLL